MKIFFYSSFFAPSVGGIEKMAELLCREFTALGHEVVLATQTPGNGDFPFSVKRRPSFLELVRLARWCDVHIQANVSLKSAWIRLFALHKSFYRHGNVYQRDDGTKRIVDHLKTAIARATPGIANSDYTAARTGARDVILNAYDDTNFNTTLSWEEKDRDLVFLGRLVSQKGCDTLVEALRRLATRGRFPNLTVIGDGPDRAALERQAANARVASQVHFLGKRKGRALAKELARHRIMIVPSRYEEPFGIVALEGLASGCVTIVSERGGLIDALAGHGFVFPNGDSEALADVLYAVLGNLDESRGRLAGVEEHLERCRARFVAECYVAVFERELGWQI